jgi:hypothetical protein
MKNTKKIQLKQGKQQMKKFSSFVSQLDELTGVAPKSKGEHKFVHSTYLAQIKDPGDLEKVGPEEIGPHDTKTGSGKRPADRLDNKQKFGESVDLEENYRVLAQKGIGAERKQDIKVGHGVDYYHPKDGSKHMGKIHDMSDKGYTVKDDKTGEKHKFDYFRKEEVEHVEEGRGAYDELARRMGTSSPGFNKTPAGKAREQKRRQEHLKGQMQFTQRMGGLTGPKGKLPEEVELEEGYEKVVLNFLKNKGIDADFRYGKLHVDKRDMQKAKSALAKADSFDAKNLQIVAEEVELEEAEIHKPGTKVRVPHNGKMVSGKVVRHDKGDKHGSPHYVVDVGGYRSENIPAHKVQKEEVELEEADFSKAQTTMAHTIGKYFKKKGVGDESKGGPFAVASAMVRDKPASAKKAYTTIKAKMKNEDHQDMLMALYDSLNEENQSMFESMIETDPEKLLAFAESVLSKE